MGLQKTNANKRGCALSMRHSLFLRCGESARVYIDAEMKILYQENEKDIIGQHVIFKTV